MKTIIIEIVMVAVMVTVSASAQKMTDRTSSIHLDLTKPLGDVSNLPQIDWREPANHYTNTIEPNVKFWSIINSYLPIKEITLNIGDEEFGEVLSSKTIVLKEDVKFYDLEQDIRLPEGLNFVEVKVTNALGATVSNKRVVMVGGNSPEKILRERKDYALLFATNNYQEYNDLVNPIDDADSIKSILTDQYGFETELVRNPTSEQIWDKIREYNEKIYSPYDQLVVFFAGHGTYDEILKEGYYIATNSIKDDASGNSFISHIRLGKILDNNPCRRILLIMDSCFGGALEEIGSKEIGSASTKLTSDYELSQDDVLVRKLSYQVRKFFTSGGKEYVSDGIKGQNSPFASKLIDALSTGGNQGLLTTSQIQVVMERLPQQPRFGEFGHNEVLGDFVFLSNKNNY